MKRGFSAEQIIGKLREAEVLLSQGKRRYGQLNTAFLGDKLTQKLIPPLFSPCTSLEGPKRQSLHKREG